MKIWRCFELVREDKYDNTDDIYPYELDEWHRVLGRYENYISLFETKIRGCDYWYALRPVDDTNKELKGVLSFTCDSKDLEFSGEQLAELINNFANERSDLKLIFKGEVEMDE
jgi:hypothetical protein